MGSYRWNAVLQLCICLCLPVCRTDCPYKECFCPGSFMDCSGMNLQALPQLVYTNASIQWFIDLDNNNISQIPGESLPPNLSDINLEYNPITTMDEEAFDGSANTLTGLHLAYARFSRFPDAIGRLRVLTYLSIKWTNITDWNDDVWRNIGRSLQTLDLEDVGISVWPSWTQHFTKLTNLSLVQGTISSIPDGALDSVADSLTILVLSNNRLTMVPKALSNLNALQTLYLPHNHIADIRWLPQKSQLTVLSFSYNSIWNASQLSEVLLPYNTSLNSFDIDNNHLTSIPNISYLINVRTLQFTHNQLSDSISGDVPSNVSILDLTYNSFPFVPKLLSKLQSLTYIHLSNNAIRVIRDTDFHKNTNAVDLGYNLITELSDTSFSAGFGLQELDLNNNPLVGISPVALQHLPSLNYLVLRNTKITRLPLGLSYLKHLYSLDVSQCASLVCTCMESSLTAWVTNLGAQNIPGNCGQTSVYDFFSVLSPSCPSEARLW
ncbi:hypothetical protein BsWGS_23259 [Bradybaena similaris]